MVAFASPHRPYWSRAISRDGFDRSSSGVMPNKAFTNGSPRSTSPPAPDRLSGLMLYPSGCNWTFCQDFLLAFLRQLGLVSLQCWLVVGVSLTWAVAPALRFSRIDSSQRLYTPWWFQLWVFAKSDINDPDEIPILSAAIWPGTWCLSGLSWSAGVVFSPIGVGQVAKALLGLISQMSRVNTPGWSRHPGIPEKPPFCTEVSMLPL